MTIREFIKNYNLHDSLLESIEFNEKKNIVKLTIDYCYWQQEDYKEGKQETGIVYIIFSKVESISYDNYKISSDPIISCEEGEDGSFVMYIESEIKGEIQTISILAKQVEIMKDL